MSYQPADTLRTRTFFGLLVAQFLAAFNDQAIHASSMFFAIHQHAMTEATAISLMPILFYAPWALFCTVAGYLADRYSKRTSLVIWKIAEVGITLVALAGFWLGTHGNPLGPYLVLSTVFLMGTHSAFFVPAKYGAMPEILQPHLLSRGNGLLESLSFLAVILGTVSGGILSFLYRDREYIIGFILVGLAVVGAAASFLIRAIPAANPQRSFPPYLYGPLWNNLRTLVRSRPLRMAVLGIAFFTFVVAFMRATVYMHGESRIPRWTELQTSIVVGVVALGIGLGSPLAGFFSGGKVELGLVPLGALGMILATLVAGFCATLDTLWPLLVCIALIGFFTGFYIVPLFTLLQHRAPKASKGDAIATSNFINVTGAILASVLFLALVFAAQQSGMAPPIPIKDNLARGTLNRVDFDGHGRPVYFEIQLENRPRAAHRVELMVGMGVALANGGSPQVLGPMLATSAVRLEAYLRKPEFARRGKPNSPDRQREPWDEITFLDEDAPPEAKLPPVIDDIGRGVEYGSTVKSNGTRLDNTDTPSEVIVSSYTIRNVTYYQIRRSDQPPPEPYNNESLPAYLFVGAAALTLVTLILLCFQLPDFFLRSLAWLRSLGRYRLKVIGVKNLPADGPVLLATNCDGVESYLQVLGATDRFAHFLVVRGPAERCGPLLRLLVRRACLGFVRLGNVNGRNWEKLRERGSQALAAGDMVGLPLTINKEFPEVDNLFKELRTRTPAVLLPVYCGPGRRPGRKRWWGHAERILVVIGQPLPPSISPEMIRHEIRRLGDWLERADQEDAPEATTSMIPGASDASPTVPAVGPPNHP